MATAFEVVGGSDLDRATEEARKARVLFEALSQKLRGPNGDAPGIDCTVLDYYEGDVDAAAAAYGIDLDGQN